MNTDEIKKKNKILKVIVILIILILLVSLIGYGWARYISSKEGDATAQVAKWSFKVVDGVPETEDVLDFAITRTDSNNEVKEGKLAPGTYGEFKIEIDATGTETNLTYEIMINLKNKPKNLKIYKDKNKKEEINVENNMLDIKKFLTYTDAQTVQTEMLYWSWPLETGSTQEEIDENDIEDSKSMNQTMSMEIAVTGVQTNSTGGNIVYGGNGATSGGMFSEVVVDNENTKLADNAYKREYIVKLDADEGEVENNELLSKYQFSHWSTSNKNENVLFYSPKEVDVDNDAFNSNRSEFMQYEDLAPYIDNNGLGKYYLSFDIKSENVDNNSGVLVYFQNGSNSKYKLWKDENSEISGVSVNVTTEYQHKNLNVYVTNNDLAETKAMLAFYGTYHTENYPVVKNVTFDIGGGYENKQEVQNEILKNAEGGNINLYAKWIPQPVKLPTPTKSGYTFLGWYTEKENGTKVENTNSYIPTKDVTLYAHWQQN